MSDAQPGRPGFSPADALPDDEADILDATLETTNPAPRGRAPKASKAGASATGKGGKRRRGVPRPLLAAGLGALCVGLATGLYFSARPLSPTSALPAGHPSMGSVATPTPTPLDAQREGELKGRIALNSTDAAALKELAAMYSAAGKDDLSVQYQQKLVDLNPTDTDNRTVLGVYCFNKSDLACAEKQWLEVTKQNPKAQSAYYDLGYLYMIKQPPDTAKTQQMWEKVVAIDPTSDMAKSVQDHLGALATASASPKAGVLPKASTSGVSTPSATPTK